MNREHAPILILGAGINGAAIARELAINGVPVVLVDTHDLAFGATAYSSRLIHGGLRYLEYGEFDLVRESLAERGRLLRLAPQFVRPLRLFIPVENRFGGLRRSAARFLHLPFLAPPANHDGSRGLWLVRMGLWMYDRYARDRQLPSYDCHRVDGDSPLPVDQSKYRWLCAYSDAQIVFPERYVVALLTDGQRAAREAGARFDIFTHHTATLHGSAVEIARGSNASGQTVERVEPAAIVNATGAWVDHTLARLHQSAPRLIGGTKGTHLVTHHAALRQALGDKGLYAEAPDGRPVFVLPFGDATLIGTTDERYDGDPARTVASRAEIDYLLATVNGLFPTLGVTEQDIDLHYSGVRPLPFVEAKSTAAVTRRHVIHESQRGEIPLWSIIGGKLTTNRSLAEEVAGRLLAKLGRQCNVNSRDRVLPGGENYPADVASMDAAWRVIATRRGLSTAQVRAVWRLCGAACESALSNMSSDDRASLAGIDIPRGFARWNIRHEWARTVDDLVERRLMLLYDPRLTTACLEELAALLVDEGILEPSQVASHVAACAERLRTHFGKTLSPTPDL